MLTGNAWLSSCESDCSIEVKYNEIGKLGNLSGDCVCLIEVTVE